MRCRSVAQRSATVATRSGPPSPGPQESTQVAASGFLAEDLSNTVVVLDGKAVLKLYRRPEAGPHPEVEALDALAGSPHVPRLLGSLALGDTRSCRPGARRRRAGWLGAADHASRRERPGRWRACGARGRDREPPSVLAERLGVSRSHLTPPPVVLDGELARLADPHRRRAEGRCSMPGLSKRSASTATSTSPSSSARRRASSSSTGRASPAFRSPSEGCHDPPCAISGSLRLSLAHAARAAHRRNPSFDWRGMGRAGARRGPARRTRALIPGVDHELSARASSWRRSSASSRTQPAGCPNGSTLPPPVLPFILETP